MTAASIEPTIRELESSTVPKIRIIKKAQRTGRNLGIFASSFNPVTNAHLNLIETAAERFALDEVLALAGTSNADKTAYECPLIDRIEMLALALVGLPQVSIGLTSTGFFVDMIAALDSLYPAGTEFSFIVGVDTFIRVLDRDGKYVERYHTRFANRSTALGYLLEKSRLIVAERGPHGESGFNDLLAEEQLLIQGPPGRYSERISFMSFPSDFSERSATEVRDKLKGGHSVEGLVPRQVVDYITSHGLYSANKTSGTDVG